MIIRNLEVKKIIIWIYALSSFPFLDLSSLNANQWSKVDAGEEEKLYTAFPDSISLFCFQFQYSSFLIFKNLHFSLVETGLKRPSISILNEWLLWIEFWPLPAPSKKKKADYFSLSTLVCDRI